MDYLIAGLLVISGLFGLAGSIGLLKLPDLMQRLHAPTLATTLGLAAALAAGVLAGEGLALRDLLIAGFLFLTAPISALFIAKTHLLRRLSPEDLPRPGKGGWGTFGDPAAPPPGPPPEPPPPPV